MKRVKFCSLQSGRLKWAIAEVMEKLTSSRYSSVCQVFNSRHYRSGRILLRWTRSPSMAESTKWSKINFLVLFLCILQNYISQAPLQLGVACGWVYWKECELNDVCLFQTWPTKIFHVCCYSSFSLYTFRWLWKPHTEDGKAHIMLGSLTDHVKEGCSLICLPVQCWNLIKK